MAAVGLALATPAFACVPPALRLSPEAATPGSAVTVSGSARVQKEIVFHWNGIDGPVLARATPAESKFSATFTVPDAAPGYYLVTAVQPGNFDNTFVVRSSLQVLGPDGQAPVASPRSMSRGPSLIADPAAASITADSATSSTASVLPFIVILAVVGASGITTVLVVERCRRQRSTALGAGE